MVKRRKGTIRQQREDEAINRSHLKIKKHRKGSEKEH